MRLGRYGLIDVHALLILGHVAAGHEHLAVAHRQVQSHARIVGIGLVALLEDAGCRRIVLAVEGVAALYLVNLGHPAVRLAHLGHVAVKLGQLGRLLEILQRLGVVLRLQRTAAQHEVALRKRRLGRGDHRSGVGIVEPLVDHLFELGGRSREILGAVSGGRFVVKRRDVLRRERRGGKQRDCRYK